MCLNMGAAVTHSSNRRPTSGDRAPVLPNNHRKREFEKCCYRGNPILWAPVWGKKEEENVNDCVCECVMTTGKPVRRFNSQQTRTATGSDALQSERLPHRPVGVRLTYLCCIQDHSISSGGRGQKRTTPTDPSSTRHGAQGPLPSCGSLGTWSVCSGTSSTHSHRSHQATAEAPFMRAAQHGGTRE